MKVFELVLKHYAIFGISSPSSNQWTQTYSFNGRILFGFFIFGCSIVQHFMYIVHVVNGFMEYVEGLCMAFADIFFTLGFASFVFKRTSIFECIDKMEKLIDTRCKYPESKEHFLKTNRQVERLSEIIFMVMLKLFAPCFMLPKFIVSYGAYFITDSGRDSFQLPFPLWFPFDWRSPIGYLVAFILEYIGWGYESLAIACTLSLGIGAFWFAISAIEEFQRFAPVLNDKAQARGNQLNEFKTLFVEFIDAHGIIKHLEHDFSDIFQPIVISVFTWSLFAISSAMLFIQVEIVHHGDVMHVLLMALTGLHALTLVFIGCEIGHRLNNAFDELRYTVDQFDWYLFPIEIERMLPMIIAIAQQPIKMECFGSITCTREVFKNILHRAYSYFMVLRQFGN